MTVLFVFPIVCVFGVLSLFEEASVRKEHPAVFYSVAIFAVTPVAIFLGGLLPTFVNSLVNLLTR
jgi:hypothetical protein